MVSRFDFGNSIRLLERFRSQHCTDTDQYYQCCSYGYLYDYANSAGMSGNSNYSCDNGLSDSHCHRHTGSSVCLQRGNHRYCNNKQHRNCNIHMDRSVDLRNSHRLLEWLRCKYRADADQYHECNCDSYLYDYSVG